MAAVARAREFVAPPGAKAVGGARAVSGPQPDKFMSRVDTRRHFRAELRISGRPIHHSLHNRACNVIYIAIATAGHHQPWRRGHRAHAHRYSADMAARDHGDPGDAPSIPPPLAAIANPARPSAAEEARTIAASTNTATLASLTADGDPWASLVTYGLLDGSPVLCVSHMAEHGRNLAGDRRASLSIVAPAHDGDPLANGRITLAGIVAAPSGLELEAARRAHVAAVPAAKYYIDYSDFSVWALEVRRVRWVGGYGRMDSATAQDYSTAEADPVTPHAATAIAHLNTDHADSLALMARTLGGYPDTDAAECTGADRYGLDLRVRTPRGVAYTRIGYPKRLDAVNQMRSATVELVQQARGAVG
jgi:heme iron utilization protein